MLTRSLIGVRFYLVGILLAFEMFAGDTHAESLPASKGAPELGQKAPGFTLPDASGKRVSLSDLLAAPVPAEEHRSWLLLIFYRGFW